MHVSRLRRGQDWVVPLATRKEAVDLLSVLMPFISASKDPTRGTGSFCANAYSWTLLEFLQLLLIDDVGSIT